MSGLWMSEFWILETFCKYDRVLNMRWDAIMTVMWEGAECSRIPSMPGFCIYATIAMVAAPLILGGNLKISDQKNWGGPEQKIKFGGEGSKI